MTSILLGLVAAQIPAQALFADEFINISEFKECRAMKGKSERLLCYDTIADGGIFNEEKLQQVQVETFGGKSMKLTEDSQVSKGSEDSEDKRVIKEREPDITIDNLNVMVVRVQKDSSGIYYFQTSDGQVWKQVNRGTWSSEVPFEANIKAGALGSFFMENEGGKSTRIKRVR